MRTVVAIDPFIYLITLPLVLLVKLLICIASFMLIAIIKWVIPYTYKALAWLIPRIAKLLWKATVAMYKGIRYAVHQAIKAYKIHKLRRELCTPMPTDHLLEYHSTH